MLSFLILYIPSSLVVSYIGPHLMQVFSSPSISPKLGMLTNSPLSWWLMWLNIPSLQCNVLKWLLLKLGFSPLLCTLLNSYYDNHSTKYLWNIVYSKYFDMNNGVPQGDPLSPIIPILYPMSHQTELAISP